jgi:Uma2 family endonuclease
MNQPVTPPTGLPGGVVVLRNVSWDDYRRFLKLFREQPGYRLTYDRGVLEIMSPSLVHDWDSRFLFQAIVILAEELGLPYAPAGTATLQRRLRRRGIEADEVFWIANAHRMTNPHRLNLRVHPLPDLAVEVDTTRSSLNRLQIYARLGVPELWRLDGDQLTFYGRRASGRTMDVIARSLSFPLLGPDDLMTFVCQSRRGGDQTLVTRAFRAWVQQQLAGGATP